MNVYDKTVALLLNNHASVNERDKNYITALMLAAGMKNRRVAAELLKHGAIIDHDPVVITWCLAIIDKIADAKCFGDGENMFHLRKNEDNISFCHSGYFLSGLSFFEFLNILSLSLRSL